MPRTSVARRASAVSVQPSCYPDDLLPGLQTALAALADVEVRYEIDRKHLQTCECPDAARAQLAADLERRYLRERDPCVQRLAELHQRLMRVMVLQDICSTA